MLSTGDARSKGIGRRAAPARRVERWPSRSSGPPRSRRCGAPDARPRRRSRAVARALAPGISTADIDAWVRADTRRRGGRPSQLGYHGFPGGASAPAATTSSATASRARASGSPTATSSTSTSPPSSTAFTATPRRRSTSATPSAGGAPRRRDRAPLPRRRHRRGPRRRAPRRHRRRHRGVRRARRAAASCATSSVTASAARCTDPPTISHVGPRGPGVRLRAGHGLHHRADDQPRRLRACATLDDGWTVRHRRRLALRAVRAHRAGHRATAARS